MAALPKREDFTAHSLERALERIMELEAPYTQRQYNDIREFILKSVEWNPFTEKWVIEDFGVELIVAEDGAVVTTSPITEPITVNHRPITQYQKTHLKRKNK